MLSVVAVSLAFLLTVDALKSDTFGVFVVQDSDGVAFEDRDDGAEKSSATAALASRRGRRSAQKVTMTLQASRPCEKAATNASDG